MSGVLAGGALAALGLAVAAGEAELRQLKLLYIGEPAAPRAKEFADFLRPRVARLELAPRGRFQPAQAAEFDVVLLDWPQSPTSERERQGKGPLGEREAWTRPTVLLGSAGLNLAVVWKLRGGSG
jgi:hypothetical protein